MDNFTKKKLAFHNFKLLGTLFTLIITLFGIWIFRDIRGVKKEIEAPILASTAVFLAQPTHLPDITLGSTLTSVQSTLTPSSIIKLTTIQTKPEEKPEKTATLNPLTISSNSLPVQEVDILPTVVTHTIQPHDQLVDLANIYQSTLSAIMAANEIFNSTTLPIGQNIIIPVNSTSYNLSEYDLDLPYQWQIIGYSTGNHPIEVFTFGHGIHQIVLVGGIHGGYEWNTTKLAYETIKHVANYPEIIPDNVTLHIIPSANPDGMVAIIGRAGDFNPDEIPAAAQTDPTAIFESRFNNNNVDLNRNWGCNWSEQAVWRTNPVDPGPFPFSEVENQLLNQFLTNQNPTVSLTIFWHSAASIISAGKCGEDAHALSVELAKIYSNAAGYVLQDFTAYLVTGDASDWLVTQDVPSFSVELTNHYAIDWEQNLNGLQAILIYYQNLRH